MKLIHLSDLHLGKRVNEFSLLEDQRDILQKILAVIDAEQPDGVLIAGDVYDKSTPGAEAVVLLDEFLSALAARGQRVFLISGNHDSPERVAFGGRIMAQQGVHLAPVYDGHLHRVTLTDIHGEVDIYLLPFLKPAHVRRFYPDAEINTYTDAMRTALADVAPAPGRRRVLVAHQFVTGAVGCESESICVGGTDNVDAAVFDGFDYVALGHLHRPQQVGRPTLRYCGTPLKYSFSECKDEKSVTVVELGEKGDVSLRTVPLVPLRDWMQLRGTYMELTARSFYAALDTQNYLHITLTNEQDVPEALSRLRTIYPNLMRLDYNNRRTQAGPMADTPADAPARHPLELLNAFYEQQNGQPLSEAQQACALQHMERIWEEQL